MMKRRILVILGSVSVMFLLLIITLFFVGKSRTENKGIFCVIREPIRYNMSKQELESLLGDPKEQEERSDGSIALYYDIFTKYGDPAEARFVFRGRNFKLSMVHLNFTLASSEETLNSLQKIRADIIDEYDNGPFFFHRYGSLDGEIIGIDSLLWINYVEIVTQNDKEIFLSGYCS